MAKGFCDGCQQLVGISPTPAPVKKDRDGNQVGSARRWRLDIHSLNGVICEKSGDLV